MLLFDVHTHIGLDLAFYLRGWWPYATSAVDLLAEMDANGIDQAVCFPFGVPCAFDPYAFADHMTLDLQPDRVPFDRENQALINEVQKFDTDSRLHVLAMFDPSRKVDEQIKNLQPLADKIAGLKLQGTLIKAPVADLLDGGKPLMQFAQQHDMPVLIHTAIYDQDVWAQPADCLKVAEAYPDVRFNLAHSHRFHEPTLRIAAQMPNVWVDCSAHIIHCNAALENAAHVAKPSERVNADFTNPAAALQAVYDILGPSYLWGTDNPFMSWVDDSIFQICTYKAEADALHALPAAIKKSMASDAPQAWLFGSKES
jgi:hypothetical protein